MYHFQYEKENNLNNSKSATMGFFQQTHEQVRNSCGKQATGVQATEVLLYRISSVIRRGFFLPKQSKSSRSVL